MTLLGPDRSSARARPRRWCAVLLVQLLGGVASCSLLTPLTISPPDDGGPGDGDGARDSDLDGGGDADGGDASDGDGGDGGLSGPGPLTFVVDGAAVIQERILDIDGDGTADNMLGSLSADEASFYVAALNTIMIGAVEEHGRRVTHMPRVADRNTLTDPEVVLIVFSAVDVDDPPVREDDFSGDEEFYVAATSLDACGEPRYVFAEGGLDGGVYSGSGDTVDLTHGEGGLPLNNLRGEGTISPDGWSFELVIGGALTIRDLGGLDNIEIPGDLSMLECILTGGMAYGLPSLPGLSPDLDLDDDGLETFEMDVAGEILRCIDGDRTVIEGRDCWMDPRMADAYALMTRWHHVPARFAGRLPGWEDLVEGECTDPPEQSFFDEP